MLKQRKYYKKLMIRQLGRKIQVVMMIKIKMSNYLFIFSIFGNDDDNNNSMQP